MLENKETKFKSKKNLNEIYSEKQSENSNFFQNKEKNKVKNYNENDFKMIKNNSYSGKAKDNISNLKDENLKLHKKFNSYDLSNLWQSFPLGNNCNASNKSDNYQMENINDSNKKEQIKSNEKMKNFIQSKEVNTINNYENADRSCKLNANDKIHFCNIDIYNKYLTKGFSSSDKSAFSNFHQNNFIQQGNYYFIIKFIVIYFD